MTLSPVLWVWFIDLDPYLLVEEFDNKRSMCMESFPNRTMQYTMYCCEGKMYPGEKVYRPSCLANIVPLYTQSWPASDGQSCIFTDYFQLVETASRRVYQYTCTFALPASTYSLIYWW
jgi:hypothetical protein